jgi:predicted transcriptional regulator
VGLARIKHVLKLPVSRVWKEYGAAACVSKAELEAYFLGLRDGYAILLEGARPLKQQLTMGDLHLPVRHCSPAILPVRYCRVYCVAER